MKRKNNFVIIFVVLAFTLACTPFWGFNISNKPSKEEEIEGNTLIGELEIKEKEQESPSVGGPAVVEPAQPIAESDTAGALPQNGTETRTYSVTATNNGCVCAVDGNDKEVTFVFNDSGLEVFHSPDVPIEFIKTGENTYTHSYMYFYFLDGVKVPEEHKDVITFTNTGYTDEHFAGDLTTPCCVHTYTNK